jgi:hypothetical protein
MKKNKGRKKFVNLDITGPQQSNLKAAVEYETPLQSLEKKFPEIDYEIVEQIFEDCGRNLFLTQKKLEEMSIVEEANNIEYNENSSEGKSDEKYEDINAFVKFRYDDPFIDDNEKNKNTNQEFKKKKLLMINPDSVNMILSQQKKTSDAYESILSLTDGPPNNLVTNTPLNLIAEDNYLEEVVLDYYIDILLEFFPKHPRQELMEKICEFDFDIDMLILHLLDINDTELNELDNIDISVGFKDELLCNLYLRDELEYDTIQKNNNIQSAIEKEIKKNNVLKKACQGNLFNENDFPFLSEDIREDVLNSQKASDEYFLDKEIKDVKNSKIKEDLTKLVKNFPMIDEFEIKWVYFNFLDYHYTYKHLSNNSVKNINKKNLFDDKHYTLVKSTYH